MALRGGGLFLANSVYRWDVRKMIVNEGGGKRKAYKNFTEPQERDQGKFNRHKQYPQTSPPPTPLGDKQQPVVHWCFEDPECLLSLQS